MGLIPKEWSFSISIPFGEGKATGVLAWLIRLFKAEKEDKETKNQE